MQRLVDSEMRKSSNWVLLILILVYFAKSLQFLPHMSLFRMSISPSAVAKWSDLEIVSLATDAGNEQRNQRELRQLGEGNPHTDSLLRTFGSSKNPDVTFFRDNAGWCPYCQKVWILLEEKNIPYKVEKINMRSYGDKPAEFLRKVPNGLLPAIEINGQVQTESFQIMMYLDQRYHGENYKAMWPKYSNTAEQTRAKYLMNLERKLFSAWCGLVFRPFTGLQSRHLFEKFMDDVNNELEVESGPWFLSHLSIVDLTYISHIERMCASVPYWCGFKVRGDSRWPAIERWIGAFEERPSYMATKSDYYTHVKDIPPQYGQAYAAPGSQAMAATIDGLDGSWNLPLPPFAASDLEPVSAAIDPGSQAACHEAAFALIRNHKAVVKFACRGSGTPGWKQFQAPLSDPYAKIDLSIYNYVDCCLRLAVQALLEGYSAVDTTSALSEIQDDKYRTDPSTGPRLRQCMAYLRDRVGVPRDMSYPAARQFRAHLNWVADLLLPVSVLEQH